MKISTRFHKTDRGHLNGSRKTTWFWRGVFVSAVANSLLAAADLNYETQSVWSDTQDTIELHSASVVDSQTPLMEVELSPDESIHSFGQRTGDETKSAKTDARTLAGVFLSSQPKTENLKPYSSEFFQSAAGQRSAEELKFPIAAGSRLEFPVDVPRSEILRVSKTFHGMIQESLRESAGLLSRQFVGSIAKTEFISGERLAELETTLIDEATESEDGYAVGQDVDSEVESKGLDPLKIYTVVNGRVHAVTPLQPSQSFSPGLAIPKSSGSTGTQSELKSGFEIVQTNAAREAFESSQRGIVIAQRGSAPKVIAQNQSTTPESVREAAKLLELPPEQVNQEISKVAAPAGVAALDSNPIGGEQVTVRGRVILPVGFAKDRAVLRVAGTGFQVQTDAAGSFELRDVPRNTRFEMLVWHLDGSLTRRLVPVVASGREKNIEIHLQKTTDVDSLAAAFSLVHQMNQGGFCARLEHETPAALAGGHVVVSTGRKILQAHYFSANGLPSEGVSELSEDGRFCVFNIEESLVDVKISLLNGTRRQLVVHVEPSIFEHDLSFDVSEALYRKISLLEPLDTQQVLELAGQGVQPEFGDKRLRDWLNGEDVPVWTKVSRFLMQSDQSYAAVRPSAEDLQYFPGGQEILELRLSPDQPGAPWSRVLLSRDQLLTNAMLRQIETFKTRIFQDRSEAISVPALDADAWDDIVAQNVDVPHLQDQTIGGLYLSLDSLAFGRNSDELMISVRDTWSGKDVCKVVPLRGSKEIKKTRYLRAVCGAAAGQYALIVENRDGALLWSDIVRIRPGDVQTVTVLDPKF